MLQTYLCHRKHDTDSLMNIDTRLLSGIGTFIAVVETGNFARAAEALGLTPSGVSRSITRLEERLGIRLFERNARSTVLTESGRSLFTEVAPLLIGISEAASNAVTNDQLVYGRLRVNCDGWFASLMLAPRLQPFLDAHPNLSLDLIVRDSIGDLVTDGFDMAIRFGEPEANRLVTRKLAETRIVTCAAPAYLERHGRPHHPSELTHGQHQCLLFRDPATGRPFDWEFHRAGKVLPVKVNGRLFLNDVATSLAACMAGLGIAQPMALGIGEMLADGRLVELFPEWNEELFPLHAYYPSRHLCPCRVRAFMDFVSGIERP